VAFKITMDNTTWKLYEDTMRSHVRSALLASIILNSND
jgi:hypothetical protein